MPVITSIAPKDLRRMPGSIISEKNEPRIAPIAPERARTAMSVGYIFRCVRWTVSDEAAEKRKNNRFIPCAMS